jgi:WD40 repeat protein
VAQGASEKTRGEVGKRLGPGEASWLAPGPKAPESAPTHVAAPAGAGADGPGKAGKTPKNQDTGGQQQAAANKKKPWRSSQLLQAHKSPVTALTFVGEGELGPKPALLTAAGDWKVVHWEPDDDGKWRIVNEVPVSHAAWIMDMCYVSTSVCVRTYTRGPLLITAAGDKTLKVLQFKGLGKHKASHMNPVVSPADTNPVVSPTPLDRVHAATVQPGADAKPPPHTHTNTHIEAEAAAEVKEGGHAAPRRILAAQAQSTARTSPPNLSRQPSVKSLAANSTQSRQASVRGSIAASPVAVLSRQASVRGSVATSPMGNARGLEPRPADPVAVGKASSSVTAPQQLSRQASVRGSVATSPTPMPRAADPVAVGEAPKRLSRQASVRGSVATSPLRNVRGGGRGGGQEASTKDGDSSAPQGAVLTIGAGEHGAPGGLSSEIGARASGIKTASVAETASVLPSPSPVPVSVSVVQGPGGSPPLCSPMMRSEEARKQHKEHKEWEEVATLLGHRDSVYCVCCTQLPYTKHAGGNGTPQLLLASVGLDFSVRIWRMLSKGDPRRWQCEATMMDATSGPYPGRPLQFMPNDPSMIVTANAEDVQLWHLTPGDTDDDIIVGPQCVAALQGHMSSVTCVQFRPDSAVIASCDLSGEVRSIYARIYLSMYVCMCVCVCVCVCIHVCVCVCTYVDTVRTYIRMYIRIYIHAHTHTLTQTGAPLGSCARGGGGGCRH